MKVVLIALVIVVLCVDGMGLNLTQRKDDQQLTNAESQAVRQLVVDFTTRFLQTKDLSPVIKDLYAKDFINRYLKAKSSVLDRPTTLDFVPGLFWNSTLFAEASTEDWLRFYTAANNFMFFGIESLFKKTRDGVKLTPENMYPSTVQALLKTNGNLSNMMVNKGRSKPVSSVEEMQKATAILEQAVALMREQTAGERSLYLKEDELMEAMKDDKYFKQVVKTVDDKFFGFPPGTELIFVNTPILFRLIIVKTNNKLEILWAEPSRT